MSCDSVGYAHAHACEILPAIIFFHFFSKVNLMFHASVKGVNKRSEMLRIRNASLREPPMDDLNSLGYRVTTAHSLYNITFRHNIIPPINNDIK